MFSPSDWTYLCTRYIFHIFFLWVCWKHLASNPRLHFMSLRWEPALLHRRRRGRGREGKGKRRTRKGKKPDGSTFMTLFCNQPLSRSLECGHLHSTLPWELPGCLMKDTTSLAFKSLDLSLNPWSLAYLGMLDNPSKLPFWLILGQTSQSCGD